MSLSVIVAVAENGVIGRDGDLPWRLSADLRRFKRLTMGHTIVMGRKTFESIGRALPGRTSVVITRQENYRVPDGVRVAHDLSALESDEEQFVIGGAALYSAALPQADRLYLTRVHAHVEGDTFFPPWDPIDWKCVQDERHTADLKNDHDYSFQVYQRAATS